LASVLGVVIVLVVMVLTMISQKAKIANLESKIKGYNEELAKLAGPKRLVDDYLKKQAEVNTKLNEIASIDKTRFYTVTLLDQLSQALPDYLWLTSMKDDKDLISMEGMTFPNSTPPASSTPMIPTTPVALNQRGRSRAFIFLSQTACQ